MEYYNVNIYMLLKINYLKYNIIQILVVYYYINKYAEKKRKDGIFIQILFWITIQY